MPDSDGNAYHDTVTVPTGAACGGCGAPNQIAVAKTVRTGSDVVVSAEHFDGLGESHPAVLRVAVDLMGEVLMLGDAFQVSATASAARKSIIPSAGVLRGKGSKISGGLSRARSCSTAC